LLVATVNYQLVLSSSSTSATSPRATERPMAPTSPPHLVSQPASRVVSQPPLRLPSLAESLTFRSQQYQLSLPRLFPTRAPSSLLAPHSSSIRPVNTQQ